MGHDCDTNGKAIEYNIDLTQGNERLKHNIGQHVHDREDLCALEHSGLSIGYHSTIPTAALSILSSGFAGCTGAGSDEMFKAWHQQPEGSYHADEPRDCVGKYPHSMETAAGSDLAPGEFYTNDGSLPATALITILYAKGKRKTPLAQTKEEGSVQPDLS